MKNTAKSHQKEETLGPWLTLRCAYTGMEVSTGGLWWQARTKKGPSPASKLQELPTYRALPSSLLGQEGCPKRYFGSREQRLHLMFWKQGNKRGEGNQTGQTSQKSRFSYLTFLHILDCLKCECYRDGEGSRKSFCALARHLVFTSMT